MIHPMGSISTASPAERPGEHWTRVTVRRGDRNYVVEVPWSQGSFDSFQAGVDMYVYPEGYSEPHWHDWYGYCCVDDGFDVHEFDVANEGQRIRLVEDSVLVAVAAVENHIPGSISRAVINHERLLDASRADSDECRRLSSSIRRSLRDRGLEYGSTTLAGCGARRYMQCIEAQQVTS